MTANGLPLLKWGHKTAIKRECVSMHCINAYVYGTRVPLVTHQNASCSGVICINAKREAEDRSRLGAEGTTADNLKRSRLNPLISDRRF